MLDSWDLCQERGPTTGFQALIFWKDSLSHENIKTQLNRNPSDKNIREHSRCFGKHLCRGLISPALRPKLVLHCLGIGPLSRRQFHLAEQTDKGVLEPSPRQAARSGRRRVPTQHSSPLPPATPVTVAGSLLACPRTKGSIHGCEEK